MNTSPNFRTQNMNPQTPAERSREKYSLSVTNLMFEISEGHNNLLDRQHITEEKWITLLRMLGEFEKQTDIQLEELNNRKIQKQRAFSK